MYVFKNLGYYGYNYKIIAFVANKICEKVKITSVIVFFSVLETEYNYTDTETLWCEAIHGILCI